MDSYKFRTNSSSQKVVNSTEIYFSPVFFCQLKAWFYSFYVKIMLFLYVVVYLYSLPVYLELSMSSEHSVY